MFKSPTRPSPSCRPRCSAHPDLCSHLSSFFFDNICFQSIREVIFTWYGNRLVQSARMNLIVSVKIPVLWLQIPVLKGSKVMQTKRKGCCGQTKSVSPTYTLWVRGKTCLGQTHAEINCQVWEAVSHIAHCFHDLFLLSRKRLERVRNNFDITCPIPDKAKVEDKTFPRGTSERWCDDPAEPWVVVAVQIFCISRIAQRE